MRASCEARREDKHGYGIAVLALAFSADAGGGLGRQTWLLKHTADRRGPMGEHDSTISPVVLYKDGEKRRACQLHVESMKERFVRSVVLRTANSRGKKPHLRAYRKVLQRAGARSAAQYNSTAARQQHHRYGNIAPNSLLIYPHLWARLGDLVSYTHRVSALGPVSTARPFSFETLDPVTAQRDTLDMGFAAAE